MKKIFVLLSTFFIFSLSNGQLLKYVIFSGGADVTSFSFITDQQVIIKISPEGKIMEWGMDLEAGRFYSEPGKLQPFMGRVEYYEKQFDSLLNGKVKSIGITSVTYYGSFENAALAGKVKSIGNIQFDYYNEFENELLRGKLKTIGSKNLSYYSSFENEAYRGKLKSLGNYPITYYSTFDDKAISGRIKSIGSFNYTWYTSFDRQGYGGALKTGSRYQMIEGVMYIIF